MREEENQIWIWLLMLVVNLTWHLVVNTRKA